MIRGIYTAVSGLVTQEAKMDVITNNMANANTVGFKSDNLQIKKFDDVMIERYDRLNGNSTKLGSLSLGSRIDETTTSFEQGVMQDTGKQTDFAIDGRGFFTVKRDNGTTTQNYYTRDGHFHANTKGLLVTDSGDSVLDSNGKEINVGINNFTSDAEGNLTIGGSEVKVKLAIVDFNANQPVKTAYKNLIKEGDNMYRTTDTPQASIAGVKQNSLEKSNISVISEMVEMMTVMRTFETNQKILQSMDESLGKAVNEVGSIR